MRFKGPPAYSYWSAVAVVLMALTPFLVRPRFRRLPATRSAGKRHHALGHDRIALLRLLVGASVFLGGRARLDEPNLGRRLEGEEPALHSPPLGGD